MIEQVYKIDSIPFKKENYYKGIDLNVYWHEKEGEEKTLRIAASNSVRKLHINQEICEHEANTFIQEKSLEELIIHQLKDMKEVEAYLLMEQRDYYPDVHREISDLKKKMNKLNYFKQVVDKGGR